jgi:hypothetical protein
MKTVVKDPHLILGGNNVSTYVESVEWPAEAEVVDLTTGGSNGWFEAGQGIRRANCTFMLRMDEDQALFDALIWAVFISATPTWTFEARRSASVALSTANPKYTGTLLVSQGGLSLKVGGAFEKSFTLPFIGAITRATA